MLLNDFGFTKIYIPTFRHLLMDCKELHLGLSNEVKYKS